jgi:hypothetical protein
MDLKVYANHILIGSKHIHKEGILETISHRFQTKTGEVGEDRKRKIYLSKSTNLSIGKVIRQVWFWNFGSVIYQFYTL